MEALLAEGIEDVRDIPAGRLANATHERIRRVTVSGRPELDPQAGKALRGLAYPRYYLDFETIAFPVPIWKSTRPYQPIPFQWSCHIERRDGALDHTEFLDLSGDDPTRAFAENLIKTLGDRGPIFVYNQGFEGRVLEDLAQRHRKLAPGLQAIKSRLVDLLPIARESYYHPAMRGSWSIKAVLPTIAPELDYAELEDVQDGGQAQEAYLEAVAPETERSRKAEIMAALRRYCGRDTEAMIRLARLL